MKVTLVLFLMAIIMTSCNGQSELITLSDVTSSFEEANLHLKPQAKDDYPTLQGVIPKVYELIDDSLYIYVFNSQEDIKIGLSELENKKLFGGRAKSFIAKNVLVLYIPALAEGGNNFEDQIDEVVSKISKGLS